MKLNNTEKTFLKRIAFNLIKEGKEPTGNNIEKMMKEILKRDKELYNQKDKVCKILGNIVWGKIQKQEIDRKVLTT
jgi:hypothetical protein